MNEAANNYLGEIEFQLANIICAKCHSEPFFIVQYIYEDKQICKECKLCYGYVVEGPIYIVG